MAHVFIANGIRVVLRGHAAEGQELLHVFHVQSPTSPPSAADCVAVNGVLGGWWEGVYKPLVSTTCECTDVISTGMNGVPAAQDQHVVGTLGTRIGAVVTPSVTLSLKAATGLMGRRNRGRNYLWPFLTTDLVNPGEDRVQDAFRAAAVAVFNALIARLQTAGYPLCVFSQADRALHPINHYVAVDDYVDNQRRRNLGRGR